MVRTFSSLSFHHSSPITHHSSLITQNFPIFTPLRLDTVFTPNNSNISSLFVGTPTDHQVSSHCCLPVLILNSFSSHFPFTPENRVPLPKPKPEPFILALKLPRLASPPSPPSGLNRLHLRARKVFSVAKVPFFPPFCPFSSFASPRVRCTVTLLCFLS